MKMQIRGNLERFTEDGEMAKILVEIEVPDGDSCNGCDFEYEQECSVFNELLREETRLNKHGVVRVYYIKLPECRAAEVKEKTDE
jgi:hypothetical protein